MTEKEVNNPNNLSDGITNGYISAKANLTESLLPPIISNSYYDDGGSWMFSSHDIPILIGAAAGTDSIIFATINPFLLR